MLKICPFLQQECIGGRCQAWNPHDTDFGWRCCTICHYWPRKDATKHAGYNVRTRESQGKPWRTRPEGLEHGELHSRCSFLVQRTSSILSSFMYILRESMRPCISAQTAILESCRPHRETAALPQGIIDCPTECFRGCSVVLPLKLIVGYHGQGEQAHANGTGPDLSRDS